MEQVPFDSLPQRIFLDSSVLQMLQDYGGQIWENELLESEDRIYDIPYGPATIESLRRIFFVNQRANWQFALSANSLQEVAQKRDRRYLQWAYDVLDHWQVCLEESGPLSPERQSLGAKLSLPIFNYLGEGDRLLIFDAVYLGCDAFLTCDFKLAKNSHHIFSQLSILVMTPIDYWNMLKPWARLYV